MNIADDLLNQARAHQECYEAGVVAGDASGANARKLAALLTSASEALGELDDMAELALPIVIGPIDRARDTLRTAIAAAREL